MYLSLDPSQHRPRLLRMTGFAHDPSLVNHRGVRSHDDQTLAGHRCRLGPGHPLHIRGRCLVGKPGFVDIGCDEVEIEAEPFQELAPSW